MTRRALERIRSRIHPADLLIAFAYLALATTVLSAQWRDTDSGYLIKSGQDQTMWEWFFAVTAHSVANLESPLGTNLQNFPAGVNMMANTAMFGVGVPFTPVTLLFGPTVTFVLALTLGLATTAYAWYWLFARELVSSRAAAAIGGLFCGFAPAMISHANAHPNFVALALLPIIAGLLIRMAKTGLPAHKWFSECVPATEGHGLLVRRLRTSAPARAGAGLPAHKWFSECVPATERQGLLVRRLRTSAPARAGAVAAAAPRNRIRDAVALALLVAAQIALGEEPLLIFALAFGLFVVVYHLREPRQGVRVLRALAPTVAAAAGLTLLLTAVPLWWQFFGPQSYRSIDHGPMGNDLKTLVQFPSESLGGAWAPGQNVAINETEQNAYFGWPLLLVLTATVALLWRDRVVRAAAAVIAVFGVLSLGSVATLGKRPTGVQLPWALAEQIPLLNSVLETRLTMAAVPAIAAVFALASDRAVASWKQSAADWKPLAWFAALTFALLPLTPTVLPVTERAPAPRFFTDGAVRQYVDDGSVVVIPPPRPPDARALRWQADTDFVFPLADGYFVGPTGVEKKGSYGPEARQTAMLLVKAQDTGVVPPIGAEARAAALADLRFWQADVLVLPTAKNSDVLTSTVTQLLGFAPTRVEDVWIWDVRALV
ncbi:glycosyl transferase [Nocardia sp. NPDC050713]|uniref:glycosyl transferase n=1 Tax=Nocardia sp. NPDC050713 TaxID=3154511 RepID=UPI0033FA2650